MSKASKNVTDLLAAIQRKSPNAPAAAEIPAAAAKPVRSESNERPKKAHAAAPALSAPKAKTKNRGKAAQFWLHDEDRKLIREYSAWLAGQGMRPSDSMVIRAALRAAKTGGGFLDAYRDAASLDGRLKLD